MVAWLHVYQIMHMHILGSTGVFEKRREEYCRSNFAEVETFCWRLLLANRRIGEMSRPIALVHTIFFGVVIT